MRNLKRVLSLALASVMLLGMMVIGAGAADKTYADLTDSAKISNQEAVSLMVDLGIIEGKPDGSYAPSETVDRATMAKLITMMLMGNVDQTAFEGTVTDLTDIDTSWAEGYIKYCYANGIITGDGLGHFFPTQPVTVVQAAKMLLVAIGYDADDRGYQGDANWSTNIMRDAQTTLAYDHSTGYTTTIRSLTKGLNVKATDPLTRDNAAQMIFNALFVQNQKPNYQWDMGTQYIQSYTAQPSLAETTYNGLNRFTGTLTGVSDGYAVGSLSDNATPAHTLTLTSASKVTADASNIGGSVVVYQNNGGIVSSSAVAATATTLATVNNGTAFANLVTKGQNGYIGYEMESTGAKVYVNGAVQNSDTAYANLSALTSAMSTTYDKIGTEIEFIDSNNNGTYDVIRVTTYTLSKVTAVTAEKADGTEATVTIEQIKYDAAAGITENASEVAVPKSAVVGDFDNLAKGDYVMYAIMGTGAGNRLYVYEPEKVVGAVSSFNTTKHTITVDGTTYTTSQATNYTGDLTAAYGATPKAGVSANFYLDANGYVVATSAISAETTVGVVLGYNLTQSTALGATAQNSITIALEDGTVKTYKYAGLDNLSSSDFTTLKNALGASVDNSSNIGNPVKFSVNDNGEITGVTAITDKVTKSASAGSLVKNTATIGGLSGKYMTSETVFLYATVSGGSYKFNTFTGIANLFAIADNTADVYYVTDPTNASIITHVYVNVDASGAANAGKDFAYAMVSGGESDGTYTTGSFAVGGALTELRTANASLPSGATAGTVYTYSTDSNGITTLTPVKSYANKAGETTTYFKATVKMVDSKYVVVTTDSTTYGSATDIVLYFAGGYSVYDVTSNTAVNAGTLAAGQEITVVVGTSNGWTSCTASTFFITK